MHRSLPLVAQQGPTDMDNSHLLHVLKLTIAGCERTDFLEEKPSNSLCIIPQPYCVKVSETALGIETPKLVSELSK